MKFELLIYDAYIIVQLTIIIKTFISP